MLAAVATTSGALSPAALRWRAVLGLSCGALLATIVVATRFIEPSADGAVRTPATAFEKLVFFSCTISMLAAWIAAVVHASKAFTHSEKQRLVVIVLLVLGNFVGAIVYFLVYAAWQAPGRAA